MTRWAFAAVPAGAALLIGGWLVADAVLASPEPQLGPVVIVTPHSTTDTASPSPHEPGEATPSPNEATVVTPAPPPSAGDDDDDDDDDIDDDDDDDDDD